MTPSPRIIIIGAGMAGIAAAIKLRQAGFDDFGIYEKADDVGGTWRENTYPGVACDVPSHLYSYSFAPNPEWSHVFSPGEEIHTYLRDIARDHDLTERIVFGAEVSSLEWRSGRWHLRTRNGLEDEAEIVVAATGVLHHPAWPDIAGLDEFDGPVFHSARWDHGVELAAARVGIIGTGSSAVQITGAIVDHVQQLHLFQRTPQWILPFENPPITEADRARYRTDPTTIASARQELANTFSEGFANAVVDADSPQARLLQQMCESNLEQSVTDPLLLDRLRPDYRAACKRLVVSGNFYPAIQRPNANLVTGHIDRVEPAGVRTSDGRLHELDVLVLATGFRVDRFLRPIEVTGRDGISLDNVWAKRPSAYLSVSIPGFPNLFLLNGPNGPVGNFSLIDVAEIQLDYIAQLLEPIRREEATAVCATAAAADRFETERVEATAKTVWVTGCRSWYLDDRGVPAAWPWSMKRFREVMARPDLDDYEVDGTSQPSDPDPNQGSRSARSA